MGYFSNEFGRREWARNKHSEGYNLSELAKDMFLDGEHDFRFPDHLMQDFYRAFVSKLKNKNNTPL